MLPVEHVAGTDFINVLEAALCHFEQLLNGLDETELDNMNKVDLVAKIKETNKNIIEAVNFVYAGCHAQAVQVMSKNLCGKPLYIEKIAISKSFYKMRTNVDHVPFKRKDLFHIPLNKRELVETQRYSMPGYPCLYLGNSLAACWEEMNRPSLDNIMFSRFRNTKEFNVLSLNIPDNSKWDKYVNLKLEIVPFVISCMIQVDNIKNKFKPEYIVPQLITESLFANFKREGDEGLPIGIKYTSVHLNKEFGFPSCIYDNLAIPVVDSNSVEYCSVLRDIFELTEPTSEEIERIKYGYSVNIGNFDYDCEGVERYKCSLFGVIEDRMKDYQYEKI